MIYSTTLNILFESHNLIKSNKLKQVKYLLWSENMCGLAIE